MMKTICSLVVAVLAASQALAWNAVGHRAVAEIAWRQMDAGERRAATDLLKQHPHYDSILTAEMPRGVDTNEWVFLTAAVWPDLVRPAKEGQPFKPESITKYNVNPHGIDIPFLMPGDTNRQLIKKFPKSDRDLRKVISDSIATLKDSKASAHDRAVSLCLVLHLCGDSHQPLHAAALLTKTKPLGNSLGGHSLVRDAAGEETNLHTFWDQMPGMDYSYEGVSALADKLMANPELQRSKLKEYKKDKTIASWVQESHEAAVSFGYAPNRIQFVDSGDVKSGKISKSEIPTISADYARDSRAVAHRRLALAACRLTDILKSTW